MLRNALILTSQREYAQALRQMLLELGDAKTRIDLELDALRAVQLAPQQYELILMDAMHDTVDGIQLLLLMKQKAASTKFIIVNDEPNERARAQAYQNGADFFLLRPRTAMELEQAKENIRALLRAGEGEEEIGDDSSGGVTVRLSDMVQTRCLSGDSVLLLVKGTRQSGDIFIYRGEIYHAQYPGKGGIGAFYDMVRWDEGLVRIKAINLHHIPPRTIEVPYRQLIAEGLAVELIDLDMKPRTGELFLLAGEVAPAGAPLSEALLEAPPWEKADLGPPEEPKLPDLPAEGETTLPRVNSHWKVNLTGDLMEGSQVADPNRCAFITSFIYRKMADVAVALEVDYFDHLMLFGPHLQQVLVADNLGVRHAVFDTARVTESEREQYVKWSCEQSL